MKLSDEFITFRAPKLSMYRKFCLALLSVILFASCQKEIDDPKPIQATSPLVQPGGFISYKIRQGEQFCDKSGIKSIETSEMKFVVKFDSSAIYQTINPANQYDINKLFGFSDNNATHHLFSARIGWRWSDNALRLFGYVYNNGIQENKEIVAVTIGQEISCSIKCNTTNYTITANGNTITMPRLSTTPLAKGYQLYPYFGGDELAPHDITILIKEL
jgi:hypothetical protein